MWQNNSNPQPEYSGDGAEVRTLEQDSAVRAIPRLSIQAFCEDPATAAVVQQVASDRRMYRTHFNTQMGGIPAAVEFFANAATPNLLIVESRLQPEQVLAELDRLAAVCDAGTKVMLIGHVNDITLYREVMQRGVSDYIVAPVMPMELVDTIATIYLDPDAPLLGRSIVFTGAKGGVGSSTIAHNVSWVISERLKQDVILADFDLPFGTAGLNFNQDPPQGIIDALLSHDSVDDQVMERLLTRCSDHLSLLASPGTLEREIDFEEESFEPIISLIRRSTPLLTIDLPHLWSGWARHTLVDADRIVITAAPDLASLRNARNLVDLLKNTRQNDPLPLLVINMAGMPKRPEISENDFIDALGIQPSLILPFDPQLFGTAANNGQMIGELAAQSAPAEGFRELAALLTDSQRHPKKNTSFLAPLLGKLSLKRG